MQTPDLDIAILGSAKGLTKILVPGEHRIQTSRAVARNYCFPAGRTEESFALMLDDEQCSGDFAESRAGEPVLLLEDFASFCTLLFAVDGRGNSAMLHAVLLASSKYVTSTTIRTLQRFREQVDALLGHPRTVVMSAANTSNVAFVCAHVRKTFHDAERVLTQLSRNPLGDNPLPSIEKEETYGGMLYVPEMLAQSRRRTLLLLTQHRSPVEMYTELCGD